MAAKRKSFLLLLIFFTGFNLSAQAKKPEFSAKQKDDIREAVYRELLPNTKKRYSPDVYFLAIKRSNGYTDTNKRLLVRLQHLGYRLRPYSACKIVSRSQVRDKAANAKGTIIFVDEIKHLSNNKASVIGGYHANNKAAMQAEYTVELKNGKWIITNIQHCIVA